MTLAEWILALLKTLTGSDRHISRGALVFAAKTSGYEASDRSVRKAIEELRAGHPEGAFILSSSEEAGYWWSEDVRDVERAIAEDRSRISSAVEKIKNRQAALDRLRARPLKQLRL